MRSVILIILGMFCVGCISVADINQNLPNNEFKTFEYHRSASGWVKDIVAKNAKKEDNKLVIEEITVDSSYPWVSFMVVIEGYSVDIEDTIEKSPTE